MTFRIQTNDGEFYRFNGKPMEFNYAHNAYRYAAQLTKEWPELTYKVVKAPPEFIGIYDFSHGSLQTYRVEKRHNVFMPAPCCERETISILLDGSQYYSYYQRGDLVQRAFPNLTPEERDLISVGVHPECADKFYGKG